MNLLNILKKAKWYYFAFFIPLISWSQTPVFEISGNGLKKSSFLIGTMHLGCQENQVLPHHFKKYLAQSEALVLELNLKKISEQVKIASKSVIPKERSLDLLMGENYQTFKNEVKRQYDVDVGNILRFHPMVTSSFLAAKLLPCNQPKGSENYLLDAADSLKIKVIGLETASEQAEILFSIPDSVAVKTLLDMGMNRTKAENEWNQLNQKFQQGNVDSIFQFVANSEEMAYDLDKLLINRNKNWAKKLPEMMKKQSLFIAVGAGHLGGPNGLVALLRKSGYSVVEKQ